MAYQVITGQIGVYDPNGAYIDSGWVISAPYAIHYPCNPGFMKYDPGFELVVGKTYVISYTVDNLVSGGVRIYMGTAAGINRTANGDYFEDVTCSTNTDMFLYSDGFLRVSNLKIYDLANPLQPGVTIGFFDGDKDKKWGIKYSFVPETMIRIITKLYVFKDGGAWSHNTNETRNNFFGVQYYSEITYVANLNGTEEKIFYSQRVESNRCWFSPNTGDILIQPIEGKSAGMASRLKKNTFRKLQGAYFADFLRNILTPGFETEKAALFNGAELRGQAMQITMRNEDTIEVILVEVDISSERSMFTY